MPRRPRVDARWPLLALGWAVIASTLGLFGDREDPSDARAFLLALGAVLVGAGLARVLYADRNASDDTPDDTPGP